MSHSHKKRPYASFVCCRSQKEAKRDGNRRFRHKSKQIIRMEAVDNEDMILPINMDEIMDVWSMPKDGRNHYHPYEMYTYRRFAGEWQLNNPYDWWKWVMAK